MTVRFLSVILYFLLPVIAAGQSLTIEVSDNTQSHTLNEFNLGGEKIDLGDSAIYFSKTSRNITDIDSYGISPDLSLLGILTSQAGQHRAVIFSREGDTLLSYSVSDYDSSQDPSLGIFPLNNGSVLLRDNIVVHKLYDNFGKQETTVSNSSQTSGGQVVSDVEIDTKGYSIVIYTRQIKHENSRGSKVQLLNREGSLETVFMSRKRTIKDLQISERGQFITLVTEGDGPNEVLILDRYGNRLNKISDLQNAKSAVLTEGIECVTVFSQNRAVVYDSVTGERKGSTSFGSELITVRYFPADETLIALTGDLSEDKKEADELEFHAVHLGKRKVEREEFTGSIGFNPAIKYDIKRLDTGRYQLTGVNKLLELRAEF